MPRSSLPCWVGEGYQNWEQLPVKQVLQWICTSCVSYLICESHSAQVWGIPAFWSHQFRRHFIHHHGNYLEGEYWDLLTGVWWFCVQSMIRSVIFGMQIYTVFEASIWDNYSLDLTYQSCLSMTFKVICFFPIIWLLQPRSYDRDDPMAEIPRVSCRMIISWTIILCE